MRFDPHLADIRFGCGLSPVLPGPENADAMIATLQTPDRIAAQFPVENWEAFSIRLSDAALLGKQRRANPGSREARTALEAGRELNRAARTAQAMWVGQHLNRWAHTQAPLRERLTLFWADHFTATGKAGLVRRAATAYAQSAIRPHVAGRFEDLLQAAVLHPLMVHYLDQRQSFGPRSRRALNSGKPLGLNENLAREVLELHTLGVGGPYTQADVTQLAELFTGLTHDPQMRLKFRQNQAEPGPETVLGQTYGGDQPSLADLRAVLRDLARHPATAAHLARKLAVHFVSDIPDPALVAALEQRYLDTGGDLGAVTQALLNHPAAWAPQRRNVKQPFAFMASALRALAVPPQALEALDEHPMRRHLILPMARMGQRWEQPDGPDGLSEHDSAWISPQGIAARLQWAVTTPEALMRDLPDPRDFVETALGGDVPAAVRFAAGAAESRRDGIGLILASPAFQRT